MMFKGLEGWFSYVTKSADHRDPRGTLLRYDFQTRISVCIWPLFISTGTHTLLFLFLHKISQYECQQDG